MHGARVCGPAQGSVRAGDNVAGHRPALQLRGALQPICGRLHSDSTWRRRSGADPSMCGTASGPGWPDPRPVPYCGRAGPSRALVELSCELASTRCQGLSSGPWGWSTAARVTGVIRGQSGDSRCPVLRQPPPVLRSGFAPAQRGPASARRRCAAPDREGPAPPPAEPRATSLVPDPCPGKVWKAATVARAGLPTTGCRSAGSDTHQDQAGGSVDWLSGAQSESLQVSARPGAPILHAGGDRATGAAPLCCCCRRRETVQERADVGRVHDSRGSIKEELLAARPAARRLTAATGCSGSRSPGCAEDAPATRHRRGWAQARGSAGRGRL